MSLLDTLLPVTAWLISSLLFAISIQLSHPLRLLLFPCILVTVIFSLATCRNLSSYAGSPNLFALQDCIWIHHAASILLIEPMYLAQGSRITERWLYVRKIWFDARRVTDWGAMRERMRMQEPLEVRERKRWIFISIRLAKFMAYRALYTYFVQGMAPALFARAKLGSADFAPGKRTLLRRVVRGETITGKEIGLRAFMAWEWWIMSVFVLDAYNAVIAIVFVGLLRFDEPEEWPTLFGNPLEAYSLRRFWGKFWHNLQSPACLSSGRLISRKILCLRRTSRSEKAFLAFWVFFISGINHGVAEYFTSDRGTARFADHLTFFLTNFAAITSEIMADRVLKKVLGKNFYDRGAKRVLGYLWVFGFFFWLVPKWKYSGLFTITRGAELTQAITLGF
ncbi:hypothetical protein N0V90_008997 [Kalmusia sp. IMI 367209]|nr:hypothetical protein N0V90_008997 [Kalmusia sp. IMI 367209]